MEERLPEDSNYILLSFANFSMTMLGRYEEDQEGGAFYLGDDIDDDTYISRNLIVNAWQPLPEPYRPSDEQPKDSRGHLIPGSTESLMCSHGGQRVTKLHKNGTEQGDLFRRLAIRDAAGKSRNKDSKFAGIHDITS